MVHQPQNLAMSGLRIPTDSPGGKVCLEKVSQRSAATGCAVDVTGNLFSSEKPREPNEQMDPFQRFCHLGEVQTTPIRLETRAEQDVGLPFAWHESRVPTIYPITSPPLPIPSPCHGLRRLTPNT